METIALKALKERERSGFCLKVVWHVSLNVGKSQPTNQTTTLSVQYIKDTFYFHDKDWPGEIYDPLMMSLFKSTSISVGERGRQLKEGFLSLETIETWTAIRRVI